MLSEWLIVNLTFYRFRKMYNQVGLLNVDGYYDGLLALFDKGVEEGFIDNSARKIVVIANMADELIKRMEVGGGGRRCFVRVAELLGENILLFEKGKKRR